PTAAFSQITPTPLSTATATPTATPIIYLVEEGDTLLGIAIERYTTVEEIKALNPGVVPELLQIGQALVLPPPATAVFQGGVATPIPLQVEVSNVSLYQTPVGSLWVLGEVWNRGEYAAENVQVQVSLPDEGGGPALTVTTWVEPGVIPAGAKAPFGLLISQPPAAYGQPALAIVSGATVVDLGSRYLDVAVSQVEMAVEESQVVLSGVVQNVGERTVASVVLVATLYNEPGNVVGFGQLRLEEPLAAEEERPFELRLAPPGGRAAGFAMVAQGAAGGE
ncbi:MAG: FxLYD domain-containing protein, partial [Chloroflexota bacterium]